MAADGIPTARAIVEGANSFITPGAGDLLQERGVVIMRDASANKCGVISSSYEVIANLLMSDEEFLAEKDRYVSDVLEILEKRAADEARLILARHRESEGNRFFTDISDDISREINAHYGRLFDLLRRNPDLIKDPLMRKTLLAHLPRLIREAESTGPGSRRSRKNTGTPSWPARSPPPSYTRATGRPISWIRSGVTSGECSHRKGWKGIRGLKFEV